MQQTAKRVLVGVLVVSAGGALTGCSGSHSAGKPAVSASSPGATGQVAPARADGRATVVIAGHTNEFAVVCTDTKNVIRASGDRGVSSATLVTTGPVLSVVLTTRAKAGGSTSWQAVNGLKNGDGKVVGAVKVAATKKGRYTGTGTFVSVELDRKGAKVDQKVDTLPGSFTLSCN
jgi:hypothetical protein